MATNDLLFRPESMPPRVCYDKLFSHLPAIEEPSSRFGRPHISRNALLRALIYKSLRRLSNLTDLVFELNNNASMCSAIGLSALSWSPSVERFSSFLRHTSWEVLEQIRAKLVRILLYEGVIKAKVLALDSCPIVAPVRQNNPKASATDGRFDKNTCPKGDPEARLGVMVHHPSPVKHRIEYFWGYRNHVVVDTATELALYQITHQANISGTTQARIFLRWSKEILGESIEAVTGDAEYDCEDLLEFIVNKLKALPVIPHNPRSKQNVSYRIQGDTVYCGANLPMLHRGKMTNKRTGITYRQYSCPLHWGKKTPQQTLFCPVMHPKFTKQKGCNVLLRLTPSIRSRIDYGSQRFKEIYKSRISAERVFSRLLAIAMQEPTVRGLNATRNHATVAHIAVLLVALAAHRSGHPDKLRFVKSFVPNFLI